MHMKKYIQLFLFLLFIGISFAQDTISGGTQENYIEPGKSKTIVQDLNLDTTADLQNIKALFCELGANKQWLSKELSLELRPWQSKEICIAFFNQWDTPIDILYGFTKWKKMNNGAFVCESNIDEVNDFSKFISHNDMTWVTVPVSGNIIKKMIYTAPRSATGDIYWCLIYKLNRDESIEPGKMFLIKIIKASYITVDITWSVYNFWRRDDIKYAYTDNKEIILKILIGILSVRLLVTIIKTVKKPEHHNKKK